MSNTFFHCLFFLCILLFGSPILHAQTFELITKASNLTGVENNNGVSVADIDKDGDLDIFFVAMAADQDSQALTHSRLFRNDNNGRFTDITSTSGLTQLLPISETDDRFFDGLAGVKYGAFWGDYDNDGYPDLFLTYLRKYQLFHNEGNGSFTDVTTSAGLNPRNDCANTSAAWFDFNNDSYLDLYIADWDNCASNTLYQNRGDGSFKDISQSSNIASVISAETFTIIPYDFNQDGWQDLYMANDLKNKNSLLINQHGQTFYEAADSFGVASTIDDMGIAMGDYNKDGHFDFYITGIYNRTFYQNDGTNHFRDVSEQYRPWRIGWAWACRFADFDLDTDEDLVIANGYFVVEPQKNKYYKNLITEGIDGFEDIGEELGVDALGRGVEILDFDYDNDGDLDLLITDSENPISFYENKTLNFYQPDTLNWLKVSLEGTLSNRDALGTKLKITTDSSLQVRYYNGAGFLSQNLKPVHFGLHKTNHINQLIISWPSGLKDTIDNLAVNQHLKFTEGQGYQILQRPPSQKLRGCTDELACNFDPDASTDDGSCFYSRVGIIEGEIYSGFHQIERYRYNSDQALEVNWIAEGGKILSGEGTNEIEVQWELARQGRIMLTEQNSDCLSDTAVLEVHLDISRRSEDISLARLWIEALLFAIRKDYARPTVHARNLFHTAVALYDSWAIYDDLASPYLMGNIVHGFDSRLIDFPISKDTVSAQEEAMSFAAYRLLKHRFQASPNKESSLALFDRIMNQLGYDIHDTHDNYLSGSPSALGNYAARSIIAYGLNDGSREITAYDNAHYLPTNPPLILTESLASPGPIDPNRWQPLSFEVFIDQSNNPIAGNIPEFLSPEWGRVHPFSLTEQDKSVFSRNGIDFHMYHTPPSPPLLDTLNPSLENELYKWNFSLVSIWSTHLSPDDGVFWDISPASIGNIPLEVYPATFEDYPLFYKSLEGGDISQGHSINPKTGEAYAPNMVPRGDYTRVLAEFWADGPDSETPPGHWFTILNTVSDHPAFVKKFNGKGMILSPMEWDVKAYFILGGAMHDAAITAWGIKGWYDYIRPISAIRYMASLGQSSDPNLPNYHLAGIPLKKGYIELIQADDPLSGENLEHLHKIKLMAWKGHQDIKDPSTDVAGVGWILAQDWFPYQRPSFVSPPFAGYLSGHSTFSRAAAEVLSLITGDEFFPGGMGEFLAKKDEFLVFEKGPSVDVKLQWATYRDASDQTSLSRIWGGIHPPADDILGRIIGRKVGIEAFNYALPYFDGDAPLINPKLEINIYPNPVEDKSVNIGNVLETDTIQLFTIMGKAIQISKRYHKSSRTFTLKWADELVPGMYILRINDQSRILSIN
ncbi:MAG: FG-GAP-like repeat-containing protein [Bacteroidota bacterium]